MKKRKSFFLWAILFIPYLLAGVASFWYFKKLNDIPNSTFIIIDKNSMKLSLFDYKGNLLHNTLIATGKNFGNKSKIGDLKTPEGIFKVVSVEDASGWTHDFKDDTLGVIEGAYGPFFIRLDVPGHKGIGIHGTHDNKSLGTRASEGCIRVKNSELAIIVKHLKPGSVVVVTPGIDDIKTDKVDSTAKALFRERTINKKNNNTKSDTRKHIVK